jgi:hypothetical protein
MSKPPLRSGFAPGVCGVMKPEGVMRIKLGIFLFLFSSFVLADAVKVQVFGKELLLPDSCVLYARPSVLGSNVEYWCWRDGSTVSTSVSFFALAEIKKSSGSILEIFIESNYEIENVQKYELGHIKVQTFKRTKPLKDYHIQACDDELCIYVLSTEKEQLFSIEQQFH